MAEGTRLLSGRRRNLTEGSNPSLSAKISKSTEAHTRVGAFLFCWVGAMANGSRWTVFGFGLGQCRTGQVMVSSPLLALWGVIHNGEYGTAQVVIEGYCATFQRS